MLIKLLGTIDFIGGLILLFISGLKAPTPLLIIFGGILLVKSIALGQLKDFASWIDLTGGIIFILLIWFQIPGLICVMAGILVLQKGIFSFL